MDLKDLRSMGKAIGWRYPKHLWIIVVPWLLGATVFIWQWHVYSSAASRQTQTFGLVTAVTQGNRVYYEFTAANRIYRNYEIPLYNRRVPSTGETVTVYYDPETPTVNGITDLHQRAGMPLAQFPSSSSSVE